MISDNFANMNKNIINFSMTEEAFLLSSLKEVVKVWGMGTGHASFNFTVENGKGSLQLGFQLGLPHEVHVYPQGHPRRKCPARRERDRKRAAAFQARVQAQSDDETVPVSNKHDENITAVSAEEARDDMKIKEAEHSTLQDEFCSDETFAESIDNEDTLIEEIVVKPTNCQEEISESDVASFINYKLKIVGINMVKMINIEKSNVGSFSSCLVKIEPVSLKKIEKLKNWIQRHR